MMLGQWPGYNMTRPKNQTKHKDIIFHSVNTFPFSGMPAASEQPQFQPPKRSLVVLQPSVHSIARLSLPEIETSAIFGPVLPCLDKYRSLLTKPGQVVGEEWFVFSEGVGACAGGDQCDHARRLASLNLL